MYEYCVLIRQTGYTYIIPCIEVMRAAYANKSFLANCALNTSGLTRLTLNEKVLGNNLEIDFSENYPLIFLDSPSIVEYVWLRHTNAYNEYKSIYLHYIENKKYLSTHTYSTQDTTATGKRCSIIEVDNWFVSTLIVRNIGCRNEFTDMAINALASSGGHWRKSFVPDASCYALRHAKHTDQHWAELILRYCL